MKIHAVMRMKFDSNKVIYTDFINNVLDGCRDDHDEMQLVYLSMNLPLCQLQKLTCLILVLICLEFIIRLIESACPSLFFPNPDPLLRTFFGAFSDIDVRLEAIIREEVPPLW